MERSDRHPTEEPTARRLARARRHGQVAVSTDLSAAWGLVALLASLLAFGPAAWSLLLSLFRRSLAASVATGAVDVAAVAGEGIARGTKHLAAAGVDAGWTAGVVAVVPLAGVSAAVLLAGVAQTGGLVAWRAAASSRGGLFSGAGLQRVLGVGPWMDAGKVAIEI
ncbi:MAG: EscU/YscU/HrcU family type III secretion system export apparatus switch protein, partial [Pseudomonadota bacterium]